MKHPIRIAAVTTLALAAVSATAALATGSKQADPREAAAALVRSLRPTYTKCH